LLAAAMSGNGILSEPLAVVIRSGVDAGAARDRWRRAVEQFQAREGSDGLHRALAYILWSRLHKTGKPKHSFGPD